MATKKTSPWWSLVALAMLAPIFLYGADFFVEKSRDHRTNEATETHRVLGNPYVHMGDRVAVTQVPLGSTFFVHNRYIKTDTCHVNVSNVYWGLSVNAVHHYSMFVNWFHAGSFEADEMFVATPTLPPGRYKIVKTSVSFCNGREHYSTNFSVEVEFVKPEVKP